MAFLCPNPQPIKKYSKIPQKPTISHYSTQIPKKESISKQYFLKLGNPITYPYYDKKRIANPKVPINIKLSVDGGYGGEIREK